MSTARRQGSAAWTIAIAGLMALIVGAILLTFVVFPVYNGFTEAAFWSAETAEGARLLTYVDGMWVFWGGILLIALLSYIWVNTRQ